MQDLSYENEFDLHGNEPVGGGAHFYMKGFPQRFCNSEQSARPAPIHNMTTDFMLM